MREVFGDFVRKESLFCRSCSAVLPHALFSQTGALSNPNERLLASCQTCGDSQVYLVKDLRCFTKEEANEFSCKIAGRGRLLLGDWVYNPGDSRPGKVVKRFRIQEKENFVLSFEDGTEKNLIQSISNIGGPEALRKYKLLPFQLSSTLVGDNIYHVNRNKIGRAVGLIHSQQEKMIIELEDQTFLMMSIPNSSLQILDNRTLKSNIKAALDSVPNFNVDSISIEVSNGIVYLDGKCRHLMERETLIRFIEEMQGVLVVIPKITVSPKTRVADSILKKNLQELLYNQKYLRTMGIRIEVNQGAVELHGFLSDDEQKQLLFQLFAPVHGIVDIKMNLRKRENVSFADKEKTRVVVKALQKNGALNTARITVQSDNGTIYLEGEVQSNLQKSTASFAAMWAGKNLMVVNNLKIVKLYDGDSFIQMVE